MTDKLRVLLVEDEWLIAADTAAGLREAGYAVIGPASSVTVALRLIGEDIVDAALLDIKLSDETSLPVAKALRTRGIPFAFLTGFGNREIPTAYRDCAVLQKPASQSDILETLAKLVAR